jgi:hypothetical protein
MLPPAVRIFVCTVPQDMRRSFDRLALTARELLGEDPQSGALFAFAGKSATRVKVSGGIEMAIASFISDCTARYSSCRAARVRRCASTEPRLRGSLQACRTKNVDSRSRSSIYVPS